MISFEETTIKSRRKTQSEVLASAYLSEIEDLSLMVEKADFPQTTRGALRILTKCVYFLLKEWIKARDY